METRMKIARLAPAVYKAMAAFDASIELDPRLRELVKLRASQINGCAFCLDMHTTAALAMGEEPRRIATLAAFDESPFFDEREKAALALTDAVTLVASTHVPDDVYERAAKHFDDEELAQLILAITAINAWNRIAISTRIPPPPLAQP
jgi:AhpD family alkylhydroperoxidase